MCQESSETELAVCAMTQLSKIRLHSVLRNMFAVYSRYRSSDSFIVLFVTLVWKQHLQRLCHRHLFDSNTWLLHHDNALGPVCSPFFGLKITSQCLTSPVWFFLFLWLKGIIKGIRFMDVEAIKEAVTRELRAIPEQAFMASTHGELRWEAGGLLWKVWA